jgi:uncharacterized membrane protein YdjX (TVP38/TMEM64 family)
LTRIRLIDFIIMNVFGRLPGTLMLTMQGTAVYSQQYRLFFVLLSLSIVLTFVLYLARGYLIRKIVRAVRRTRVFLAGSNLK